jgi:hypothetical protein
MLILFEICSQLVGANGRDPFVSANANIFLSEPEGGHSAATRIGNFIDVFAPV